MHVDRWAEHSKESTQDGGTLTVSQVNPLKLQPAQLQITRPRTSINSEETDRIKHEVPYLERKYFFVS